ncbi:MAG: hypothetical protein CMP50_01660 [Flavobacteriales bacterium]|nr:hypothetical protein [Flavobacteriales bacterium]
MVTDFYNNVFKLLTSISIAQLIPIIITPILTQYFTPEDFGVYGLYVSICSIFGIVASGKYDVAIMLPQKKEDSINILFLSFLITFLFSTFCFSILNIFDDVFFKLTNSKFLKEYYFIIPISIFLISMNQSLIVWFNRNKKYNTIANQNLLKSGSNSGSSLILGIQSIHVGLIISHLISLIIISFWNIVHFMQECNKYNINQKLIRRNFLKYIDFLKFSTVSNLFNSFSNIGMTALIVIFFGPKIAGLYFLAEKLIAIPISFITSSVSQVYFQQASKLFHSNKKELIKLTNQIQKNVFFVLFPFLLICSVFGENIFSLFGDEWTEAGVIVKYFAVFILFKNIYSPISHIGDILNKQKVLLVFNVSLFIFQLSAFYFLKEYSDIKAALLTASLFGAIHYMILNTYMKQELKKIS